MRGAVHKQLGSSSAHYRVIDFCFYVTRQDFKLAQRYVINDVQFVCDCGGKFTYLVACLKFYIPIYMYKRVRKSVVCMCAVIGLWGSRHSGLE